VALGPLSATLSLWTPESGETHGLFGAVSEYEKHSWRAITAFFSIFFSSWTKTEF